MHVALSFQRVHAPKGHMVAVYHPETNMAYTQNPRGPHFTRMGHVLSADEDPLGDDSRTRGHRLWLLPEEVLYLLERGTLDVRWPQTEGDGGAGDFGVPMSLQGAYAAFIGEEAARGGGLTLERYAVYASLKRMGFTVLRAPSWDDSDPPPGKECYPPALQRTWQAGLNPMTWWRMLILSTTKGVSDHQGSESLVQPRLYRDYASIYRRLALVNFHDPSQETEPTDPTPPTTDSNFRVTYHVWKPGSATFKKSSPGPPDFRIAVVDARETSVPTLQQLSTLFETVPYDPPKPDAQLYTKLKHGYKNVILAIVDQGITSYLRIADAAFGRERLYERKGRALNNKRGGRGGRGRGR